jgi:hypothetical protein
MKKYLVLIFLFSLSCTKNNFTPIKIKDEINKTLINKTEINRGIVKLNNEFYFYSNCSMVNKKNIPNWIIDKNSPEVSFKEYDFHPRITDIGVPYVLFKFKNDKYFYILKNKDTLKFELNEF